MKKFLILFTVVFLLAACRGPAGEQGIPGGYALVFQEGVNGYAGTEDTNITEDYPDTNYDGNYVGVGDGGGTGVMRGLIKFDLSQVVPSNLTVDRAYLTVRIHSSVDGSCTVTAYALSESFSETTATWNSRVAATPWAVAGAYNGEAAISSSYLLSNEGGFETLELDAATVQSWIQNQASNYGILIKDNSELAVYSAGIYSSESPALTSRPKLTLYVSLP